jgi:hypothetical protein
MIYGPKTDAILAGALTVASGGWLIGVLLGYLQWQDWGHVLGLFVLFGIGVASLFAESGKNRIMIFGPKERRAGIIRVAGRREVKDLNPLAAPGAGRSKIVGLAHLYSAL